MSARSFLSHRTTRDVVYHDIAWKSGSTGAVPAFTSADMQRCRGLISVTRDSAGQFTLVFERGGSDISDFNGFVEQASFALTGACRAIFKSHTITASTKSVTFVIVAEQGGSDKAPTIVDPTTGDIVRVSVGVKHSSGKA